MNRFLSKKKNVDASSNPLSPPQTSSKKWKKSKKDVIEEKPQIDLGAVLPSTDDFRTSLIMPNLSARFSMLREQDDPHSLLGKASDDSVLQPQRNSRLLDFGFSSNNLNDIAEVASINSSIRPPFALDRTGSYASEEGDDKDSTQDGSVMSRARPGEGNVLFGGRQKVYKIATGSARSIGGSSERGMGRLVYEDDVNMSAFQKYRQQERERLAAMGEPWDSDSAPMSPDTEPEHRVSEDQPKGLGLSNAETGFSFLKRNSDSTTNSIPSQEPSSTATSVASQSIGTAHSTPATMPKTSPNPTGPGLERSMTKRRLYEQGLNQHMQDQQSSALSRLNSIQRQRAPTVGAMPSALNHSKSIGNLHDRRAYKPYALHSAVSPPLNPAVTPLNTRTGKPASSTSSPIVSSYPQSPISPVIPETEEYQVLHSALEQNDRGKATALGVFNKPAQQFDEQQYLKRQMQMDHVKEESPQDTQSKPSPVNQAGPSRQVSAEQPSISKFMSKEISASRQVSAESAPQEPRLARFDSGRQNSISRASQRSRSRSISRSSPAAEETVNKAFAVFQKAAIQNRAVHGDSPVQPAPATFDNNRTFFGDSDDEQDDDEEVDHPGPVGYTGRFASNNAPSIPQHPALRDDYIPEVDEEEEEEPVAFPFPDQPVQITKPEPEPESEERQEVDSPTIGMHEGIGGLISQHLRNTSDVSSIYPPNPPFADGASSTSRNTFSSDRALSGTSSAWNIDELDNYYGDIPSRISNSSANTAPKGPGLAPLPLKTTGSSSRPSTSHDSDAGDSAPWQNEYKPQHTRDASTATQAERDAFANELAARQKAIQEKMRSIVESESRGTSPGPSATGALKAFGMLKSRPSHEAMNLKQDNKSTRMLGLGLSGAHPAERNPSYEDKVPQPANIGAQWPLGPGPVPSPRPQADSEIGRTPPQQARERSRNRSGSDASRARSRSRSERNDIGMAVSATTGVPPVMPPQRPSPEINQFRSPSTEGRGRMRSNSRAAGLHPSARTPMGPSPSLSPASFNSSNVMSPPLGAPSAAPKAPFQKAHTAPMPSVPLGKPRGEMLRKKTINKFDISEPTLVSSTSNIDTVDLPAGASLRNGMDEIYALEQQSVVARRRKLFGFGREASSETLRERAAEGVASPPMNGFSSPPMRPVVPSYGSHEHVGSRKPSVEVSSIYPQTLRSKPSFETTAGSARFDAVGSPVLNEAGMF